MSNVHEVTINVNSNIVLISIGIAFIASYASITLYDQYRLCSRENKPKLFSPIVLLVLMACSLGGVAIWCMHFIGMASITLRNYKLEKIEINYQIDLTVASLCIAIVACFIGLSVCAVDKSFVKDKKFKEKIRFYVTLFRRKSINEIRKINDKNTFILKSLFVNIHLLALGGLCAATGVCVMHYIGMQAMIFKGHIVWSPGIIAASVIIALIAATAAFWIMFRLLALFPSYELLRVGSAIIMSLAVNGMHYTGMRAAKFIYDENKIISIPKSNLISQYMALEVSIIVGMILILLLLIIALADIRCWYYNLQSIVQIADVKADIYQKAIKAGGLRDQAFVNDWLDLRFHINEDPAAITSSISSKSINVQETSKFFEIKNTSRQNNVQVAPEPSTHINDLIENTVNKNIVHVHFDAIPDLEDQSFAEYKHNDLAYEV